MTQTFTLEQFQDLASSRRVIPMVRTVDSRNLSPIELYRGLTGERPGTFLLESAEQGVWSRYSFIGVASMAMLTEVDGHAHWVGEPPVGVPLDGDPLVVLEETVEFLHTTPFADLPPLTGGMVGMIGYDAVRRLERIPEIAVDDLHLPELAMLVATDLAVLDHETGSIVLIANAVNRDGTDEHVEQAWADSIARLDAMQATVESLAPTPQTHSSAAGEPDLSHVKSNTTEQAYQDAVVQAKSEIAAGEAFQIVVSQRFSLPCTGSALAVYEELRRSNPSPYMYLMRFGSIDGKSGFDVVGSSPEALVTVADGQATMHPIAGSRPRGANETEDAALATELLADEKERAEHLMLVDLGRNDLGRVCESGSVHVVEFMAIERFSHIMHIVSTVVGAVSAKQSGMQVLRACFPAGTLSGAPKPRAMEIIEHLEPTRRGVYGGVVGYLDFAGNVDTAIAIRTAVIRDGIAHIQAGAGVVADSDPATEHAECRHKAAAALRAVARASTS